MCIRDRVNITQSVYNYVYLDQLLETFISNWPDLVTFGMVYESHFNESVIPTKFRPDIINKLENVKTKLESADIESNQRHNAVNAVASTINNLSQIDFNKDNWEKFKDYVIKMDQVKGIDIRKYCPEVAQYIY